MKTKIILILLLTAQIVFISCESGVEEQATPGRRDYTWSVDTLNMPMNLINSIWGSSPNDVWVVGPGGDDENRLQHYDGIKWAPYTKEQIICTGNTIYGFSQNDVWMGGGDGAIWHFDGNTWRPNFEYKVEGAGTTNITDIWGRTANDMYACGTIIFGKWSVAQPEKGYLQSFVLHYNGYSWNEVARGKKNDQFLSIRVQNNDVYIFSYNPSSLSSNLDTLTFYKLFGQNLENIFMNNRNSITWANFNIIGNDLYFILDKDICTFSSEHFIKRMTMTLSGFGYYLFGRNKCDIFFSMVNGLVHYNGENMQYILQYKDTNDKLIGGEPAVFDKQIFCGFYNNLTGRNMILHGNIME